MSDAAAPNSLRRAAIACGGTGGHLFPGIAVGQELLRRGCAVTLLVSPKEVDQQAVRSITDMAVVTLPAIGLQRGGWLGFVLGFWKARRRAKALFDTWRPDMVLAMGGFTSAPPIFEGRRCGAKTFLHESNTIPGKANRWLSRIVDGAFVQFDQAAPRLRARRVETAGMPVRPEFFQPVNREQARAAMGLDPAAPVLLIMGGSQGARGINDLTLGALPALRAAAPALQFIHLTGAADAERMRAGYARAAARAMVHPFLAEMAPVLAAADVAVSRAGASSLAELAACRLPSVLIPYPAAADDHQRHNAAAFAETGAARMLSQADATPERLATEVLSLLQKPAERVAMQSALERWRRPAAAARMAEAILNWPEASAISVQAAPALKAQKMGASHA